MLYSTSAADGPGGSTEVYDCVSKANGWDELTAFVKSSLWSRFHKRLCWYDSECRSCRSKHKPKISIFNGCSSNHAGMLSPSPNQSASRFWPAAIYPPGRMTSANGQIVAPLSQQQGWRLARARCHRLQLLEQYATYV